MKTKDGYTINEGMWIYDTTGCYEIKSIGDVVELREILFDDEDPEKFNYGDYRRLKPSEIKNNFYYV